MIVDFLVTVLAAVLTAVLSLIPAFTLFDPVEAGLGAHQQWANGIGNYLAIWNLFLPINVSFICVFALIGTKFFVGGVQLLMFVYDKLPFKAT